MVAQLFFKFTFAVDLVVVDLNDDVTKLQSSCGGGPAFFNFGKHNAPEIFLRCAQAVPFNCLVIVIENRALP